MQKRGILGGGSLLFMTFTAIFSFNQVINNSASIGLATIPSFIVATLVYFIPFSLMIAEFASAHPDSESGYTSWLRTCLGPKWAFIASWTYFFVNLFFFTSLLPSMLIALSYTFFGRNLFDLQRDTFILAVLSIVLFWIATFIMTKGAKGIAKVTNISGLARFMMGLVFIVLALILAIGLKQPPMQKFTYKALMPRFDWTYFYTFAWILQALGGAESLGVYIKDLKGGVQTFVKTMVLSTFLIGLMYVLGCVAVGILVPTEVLHNNYSDAIYAAFLSLGHYWGLTKGIPNIVGAILFLSTAGGIVLMAFSSVKIFFAETPPGLLPAKMRKTTEDGIPVYALYVQAIILSVVLLIIGLGSGNIQSFLKFLYNMTAVICLLPVLFFIISYITLRRKFDHIPRAFRLSQHAFVGMIFGYILLLLFGLLFIVAIVPDMDTMILFLKGQPLPPGATHPVFSVLYQLGSTGLFFSFAFWLWHRYEKRLK